MAIEGLRMSAEMAAGEANAAYFLGHGASAEVVGQPILAAAAFQAAFSRRGESSCQASAG